MTPNSANSIESGALKILRQRWPAHELQSNQDHRLFTFVKDNVEKLGSYEYPSRTITLEDLLGIIDELARSPDSPRLEILQAVRRNLLGRQALEDATISGAIDSAAGLWLTVKFRSPISNATSFIDLPDPAAISWEGNASLSGVVRNHFRPATSGSSRGGSINATAKLNLELTMAHLVSSYNFHVRWTHNLAEHLTINWDNSTIMVYEHKVALWNHVRFKNQSVLPQALLEEALDTLNLLFPFDHAPMESLLKKHKRENLYGLGYCLRPRALDLDKYSYWRDRVEELHHVLDGPPVGIHQLGLDKGRKNLLQFSTFWIATAVALLTIISFVTGVYSAIYAKKQYDLAVVQFQLSVAQACAAPESAAQLPGFCS